MQHVGIYNLRPNAELLNISAGATDSAGMLISP